MDHAALSQLSKDGLIARLLAQAAHRTVPMAAQQSHPGKTLRRTASPDATIDHFPETCAGCGAALNEAMAQAPSRQVFDLPGPKPLLVTEHLAHTCRCTGCGTHAKAAFTEGVHALVRYGPRTTG